MLKFLKGLLLILAVVAFIVTIVLLVSGWIQVDRLWAVATAQKSDNLYPNPRNMVLLAAAAAFVTGALAGFGLGIPKQTFKQLYEKKQQNPDTTIIMSDPSMRNTNPDSAGDAL